MCMYILYLCVELGNKLLYITALVGMNKVWKRFTLLNFTPWITCFLNFHIDNLSLLKKLHCSHTLHSYFGTNEGQIIWIFSLRTSNLTRWNITKRDDTQWSCYIATTKSRQKSGSGYKLYSFIRSKICSFSVLLTNSDLLLLFVTTWCTNNSPKECRKHMVTMMHIRLDS